MPDEHAQPIGMVVPAGRLDLKCVGEYRVVSRW